MEIGLPRPAWGVLRVLLGIGGGLWVIFFKKLMLKASVFVFFQFKVDKNADRYHK
jgi:hypothetical protein